MALLSLIKPPRERTDIVKWVAFSRRVMGLLVISLVSIASASAIIATWQARSMLRATLAAEARTAAQAIAHAAFVPLTLEDDQALAALASSYRQLENFDSVRIVDSSGRTRAALKRTPAGRALRVWVPIMSSENLSGEAPEVPPRRIGSVEVGLATDWIDARTRRIALATAAVSGILAALILLIGTFIVESLIRRTRELVGEARLVADVKRANAELEAFSYSVAHDLRAPLRAIDGFSQILADKYSSAIDAQGRDFLRRIREASRRMDQLIKDLLNLSRLTRGEMRLESFDIGKLAKEVGERLRQADPRRDVDFIVAEGLSVEADVNLMRTALENLLDNAWKYTRLHARARIEFGMTREGGRDVFFVRDDGAGFDMAFSAKLFQPFSRLHSADAFEGTGIGLAIVQRIISRHGGKLWAKAEVEKGATFYFTLKEPL